MEHMKYANVTKNIELKLQTISEQNYFIVDQCAWLDCKKTVLFGAII